MPSFASGNVSCTACASTCAVECRSTPSPSGESIVTGSTGVSASGTHERSRSRPDGSRTTTAALGPVAGEPAFTITVRDGRGAKALAALDQFRVAVAYLQGWLDVDGDLVAALKMRQFFKDVHPIAWLTNFAPALLRGRTERDRRSISHH